MDDVLEFLKKHGGVVGVSYIKDAESWSVAVEFGRESPGSDMAAGASYGMGRTLEDALNEVRLELGLNGTPV